EASGMLQFEVARAIISEQPHSIRGWSLFHSLTLRGTESNDRRAKFLQQMRMRHPVCVAAMLVSGHHHALRGHMQGACREYLRAHRLHPHDPLICLCCGVALLNLSLGSRLRDRSQCVLQGMALLQQYAQLSGDTQEVHFNLGRAFHHVGLLHLAVDHYKRVLSSATPHRHHATAEQLGLRSRRSREGMGILAAALFTMAIGALFNAAFPSPPFDEGAIAFVPPQADYAWRVVLAAGAVPAKLTFYFRMTMLETPRFTTLVQRNAKQAARDMGQMFHLAFEEAEVEIELATAPVRTYSLLSREFLHHHGVHLLATAACWFLVDTAYYSQNLLNRDLFTAIGWVAPPYSMNALTEMYELSKDTVSGMWGERGERGEREAVQMTS
ncbi:unnamed protein product, partial [Closterium sp. NIES-64]